MNKKMFPGGMKWVYIHAIPKNLESLPKIDKNIIKRSFNEYCKLIAKLI